MYVVCNEKIRKELSNLAESNGWYVSIYNNEQLNGLRIDDESYELRGLYNDAQEYENGVYVRKARRLLSRKVKEVGDYLVIKLKNALQVGCTTIKNSEAKAILTELRRKPKLKIGGQEVEIDYEDRKVSLGGESLDFDDIEELAVFGNIKV